MYFTQERYEFIHSSLKKGKEFYFEGDILKFCVPSLMELKIISYLRQRKDTFQVRSLPLSVLRNMKEDRSGKIGVNCHSKRLWVTQVYPPRQFLVGNRTQPNSFKGPSLSDSYNYEPLMTLEGLSSVNSFQHI